MLHTVTFRTLAIATCGWLFALDAAALTLGSVRGAVLPNRPLDLTIAATLDAAETRPTREAARVPARSVLRLEPGDLSPGPLPGLHLSTGIGTQPTADPAARQAAAALWQALQKGPEEAMQEAQRVQALQRQLQSVREVERQNAADVAEMRAEGERAQSQRRTASLLAAVFAALLAAVLGALAWRWYRIRRVERVGRWFEANGKATALPTAAAAARAPVLDVVLGAVPAAVKIGGAAPVAARPAARPATVVPWSPSQLDFQASRSGSLRMVGVEELMDVHDKADFFLSIGEVGQAVAVLEGHVHDQVETSALPWMDLLELYHSLGRRADFERLRDEFREQFVVQVPDFEHFDQPTPTPTLENYGRALSRIVALWPTRRVLDVIEESIFRKPGLAGAEAFSLEAYRELALLYHIATDVSPVEEISFDEPRVTNFGETSLLVPPSSANVGVDIDITSEDNAPDTVPPLDFELDLLRDEVPDPGRGHA